MNHADMVTGYCAQRADLGGYQRMLATWREVSAEPDLAAALDRFLAAIDPVEEDTKAVLRILVAALDAAMRMTPP